MSEEIPPAPAETPEPPPPPAVAIRRGRIGVHVTVQILLGLVLFALVNYLGIRHFYQWDKTYNHEFTLSADTLNFLKRLDKKIAITVISKKNSPEFKDLSQLAESYRREGRSKLKIDVVDPGKDPEAFQKLTQEAEALRIQLDLGLFVRLIGGGEKTAATAAQYIPQASLFRYTTDMNQRQALSGFAGEASLTAALMAVARGDQPTLYVVAHKSKLRTTKDGNAIDTIINMVARQNMKVLPFFRDATGLDEIEQ